MRRLKIKDKVIVLSGKDRGKTGDVIKINYKTNKAVVDGINVRKKAMPRNEEKGQMGGHGDVYATIDLSNITLVSPKTKKGTRVGFSKDGEKFIRVGRCGSKL